MNRESIGLAVLQLRENGVLQKLHKNWWIEKGECNSDEGKVSCHSSMVSFKQCFGILFQLSLIRQESKKVPHYCMNHSVMRANLRSARLDLKFLSQKQRILETGASALVARVNVTYFPPNYVTLG